MSSSNTASEVRPWVAERLRLHGGSLFAVFFVAAVFDEVAMPEVAASVDRTGRFERNFADRRVRSVGTMSAFILGGDHSEEAGQLLKTLHRDVHGRGEGAFADVRYSALNPDQWNWILMSGLMLIARPFPALTGVEPTPAEMQHWYEFMLTKLGSLRLDGETARLTDEWSEVEEYYDRLATTRLSPNPFLDFALGTLTRLPLLLPDPVRAALTPAWLLARPVFGHVVKICSLGIMHPSVLAATRFQWKPRHTVEFRAYTTVLRAVNRALPDFLKTEPTLYLELLQEKSASPQARARYERLRRALAKGYLAFGDSVRLKSFVPDDLHADLPEDVRARARAAGCPF